MAAADGRILVAGGSLPSGRASDALLAFDPSTGSVVALGRLPAPTTHASAAALGDLAYVIGGRGSTVDTPTRRIVAVDVSTGRVRAAGLLADAALRPRRGRRRSGGSSSPAAEGDRHRATRSASSSRDERGRRTAVDRPRNVYADDGARDARRRCADGAAAVYVPNSESGTVDVIDPRSFRIVDHFAVGALPQHVVPA